MKVCAYPACRESGTKGDKQQTHSPPVPVSTPSIRKSELCVVFTERDGHPPKSSCKVDICYSYFRHEETEMQIGCRTCLSSTMNQGLVQVVRVHCLSQDTPAPSGHKGTKLLFVFNEISITNVQYEKKKNKPVLKLVPLKGGSGLVLN